MIYSTPEIGQTLVYRNAQMGVVLPVRVVKVAPAVCEVEVLAGGLDSSLKGKVLKAHVALLFAR